MFSSARIALSLILILAGCATPTPRPGKVPPPDWSQAPQIGPPPAIAPRPLPQPFSIHPAPESALFVPDTTWVSLTRWARERGLPAPRCVAGLPVATYALAAGREMFTVHIGSREAQWGGTELRLGFTPQLIDGHVWMHSLDVKKNLEPLMHGFDGVSRRPRTIVLDPGHGGAASGARSRFNGAAEKDYTFDLALRLGQLLAAQGWQVFLTRTNDTDLGLTNRVAFAAQCQADLFLSLHFNSSGGGNDQAGVETYCLTPAGMPSNLVRGYDDDPNQFFPNNVYDAENVQFALHLHRAVLRSTGQTDRGVRRARFLTVLRGQQCPAVLFEGGYLSNPREAQRIADWRFRQQQAEALAAALP